jgi:hypothetical protein
MDIFQQRNIYNKKVLMIVFGQMIIKLSMNMTSLIMKLINSDQNGIPISVIGKTEEGLIHIMIQIIILRKKLINHGILLTVIGKTV